MKRIRKSNLFTTTIVMLFFFSIIGFWGCEKENLLESQYEEYLDLDTYEMSKMSVKDMETYGQALQRLNIDKKNGLYRIKQTTGAQVNISEDLFKYITKGFKRTNEIFAPKTFNNLIPRLKSGNTEGDNSQPSDSTYCVAHSLAGMGGVSFNDAKAYLDSIYGSNFSGVDSTFMDSVVYHFYPNARKSNSVTQGGFLNNALIWYPTSDTTGHAVNGMFYDSNSGYILYNDYQNNQMLPIQADSISSIYYPY